MNMLIELIFQRIISRTLGLYTRFLFFKIFNTNKTLQHLRGGKDGDFFSQDFFTAVVGTLVFLFLTIIFFTTKF